MRTRYRRILALTLVVALAGCAPTSERAETAAKFLAALEAIAGYGGMTATVMTADGTWSGATGKAATG